tara:strand:+ start:1470 stop:1643 length:174 start_codon:yes stop_codon:yes gene_type:complete
MKQSRLTLSIASVLILSLLCSYAIYSKMDGVATILAGSIGGVVAKYNHDETKRPSKK